MSPMAASSFLLPVRSPRAICVSSSWTRWLPVTKLARAMEGYSRDLLCGIGRGDAPPPEQRPRPPRVEMEEEVELSLGLSLGGRFGLERKGEKLARSSSVAAVLMTPVEAAAASALARTSSLPAKAEAVKIQMLDGRSSGWESGIGAEPAARLPGSGSPSSASSDGEGQRLQDTLMRTSSLPAGFEDERKRKAAQSLRRLEVKKKRIERRNSLACKVSKEEAGHILEEMNARTLRVESSNDVVMRNKRTEENDIMENYFKRKASEINGNNARNSCPDDIDWEEEIKFDPGLRKPIDAYRSNQKEMVRRKYLANGPSQPRTCTFPFSYIGATPRRFIPEWFDEFGSWLEYSESKDRAYCFCCFLFREKKDAGYEAFVINGWNGYHRKERLKLHVGDVGSYHNVAMKKWIVNMFPAIVKVLEIVGKDDRDWKNRDQASNLLVYFQSFDFVFYLHLMLTTLTATNTLSLALQRKDQDIVNAIKCVKSTKCHLDELRKHGWEKVVNEVYSFCDMHDIIKLEMEDAYVDPKKPRQKSGITNKHHYEVDCFNDILDWLLQELDNRFNETSSQLLICSAAFSPRDSFRDFSVENLVSLAKLYPNDFSSGDLRDLEHQLFLYIADVRGDDRFFNIETIVELSQKMVETRKHVCYPFVYRLLKLVVVLPVATATVERCFSGMKIVKTYLRNRIGDENLSHTLICYVEKEEMDKVTNEAVAHRFMNMEERRFARTKILVAGDIFCGSRRSFVHDYTKSLMNITSVKHFARSSSAPAQECSSPVMPKRQNPVLKGTASAEEHSTSSAAPPLGECANGAAKATTSFSPLAARVAALRSRGSQQHISGGAAARAKSMGDAERMMMQEMPCVSTKGLPNGNKVEGFLYKYRKGEEVRIVCVCHGSFLTPAEFVKHAGGGDVANPLRHIVVNPNQ
ncbi:hypothetical protein ACP70R_016754 [Stipagrostis hirtigluma subsp. patula]